MASADEPTGFFDPLLSVDHATLTRFDEELEKAIKKGHSSWTASCTSALHRKGSRRSSSTPRRRGS